MFGFLKKKEYVFLIEQDKILNDDTEKELKNQVFAYINDVIKGIFKSRRIQYVDYYSSRNGIDVYSVMSTFLPDSKNIRFIALMYDMYAYTIKKDDKIFESYDMDVIEFASEYQNIKVYKFKI